MCVSFGDTDRNMTVYYMRAQIERCILYEGTDREVYTI